MKDKITLQFMKLTVISVCILFSLILFISAAEAIVILDSAGTADDVTGTEISTQISEGITTVKFTGTSSSLNVKGNEFTNIVPLSKSGESIITLDEFGDITKADFTTNEKGGTYTLGGTKFDIPANSRVQYDKNTGMLTLPEGSKINEIPKEDIKIYGSNIKLPTGVNMEKGTLDYDKLNNKWSAPPKASVTIYGIKILGDEYTGRDIYFDGARHTGEYVSFYPDRKGVIISSQKGFSASGYGYGALDRITFLEGNSIFGGNGNFVIKSLEAGSEIEIIAQEGNPPALISDGKFSIENGNRLIDVNSKEAKVTIIKTSTKPSAPVNFFPDYKESPYFSINSEGKFTIFAKEGGKEKKVSLSTQVTTWLGENWFGAVSDKNKKLKEIE